MKPLIFLLVLLTSQISSQNIHDYDMPFNKKQDLAYEFAKIFVEKSLPMYIRMKLRDKLVKSVLDSFLINKFNFTDCQGTFYNGNDFIDNYLLAGKLGENLRMAPKAEGKLNGVGGEFEKMSDDLKRRAKLLWTHPVYVTTVQTSLNKYQIAVRGSTESADLEIYALVPTCPSISGGKNKGNCDN